MISLMQILSWATRAVVVARTAGCAGAGHHTRPPITPATILPDLDRGAGPPDYLIDSVADLPRLLGL